MKLQLVIPEYQHKDEILNYQSEFLSTNNIIPGSSALHEFNNIDEWLNKVKESENLEHIPYGMVPSTQFLCINENNKIVGMIHIRHSLNEHLTQIGGHVGYSVRPDERRKGVAKWMLGESLKFLRERGVQQVLITCDSDNLGSKRTIQTHGGIQDTTPPSAKKYKGVERYWIEIKS